MIRKCREIEVKKRRKYKRLLYKQILFPQKTLLRAFDDSVCNTGKVEIYTLSAVFCLFNFESELILVGHFISNQTRDHTL